MDSFSSMWCHVIVPPWIPSGQLHQCGEGSLSMSSLCHLGFLQVSFINVVKAVSPCHHCATMDFFRSASSMWFSMSSLSGQLHQCGEGSLSMSSLCHLGFLQVSFINVVKAVSPCLHCATMDSFKSASSMW